MAKLFFDSVRTIGLRAYSAEQVIAWAPRPSSPADVDVRSRDGRTTLVATDALGEVIGYGDLKPDGQVDHLYCRPDVVGRGAGAALLDALISLASEKGLLLLHADASEIAKPLFESRGFKVIERRDFLLRGVAIHNYRMERERAPGMRT